MLWLLSVVDRAAGLIKTGVVRSELTPSQDWSKYCAAADFFRRFEEFLRKCLRKDSKQTETGGEGGIRTPVRGFSP